MPVIQFIMPALFVGTKLLVKHSIAKNIVDGVSRSKYEVERKITKNIVSILLNISINIILLAIAVYILPFMFDKNVIIYVICSVYLASIIYGLYSILEASPTIFKYIFKHKLNLKNYIRDEIYSEAYHKAKNRLHNMSIFGRVLNGVFGKPASVIASSIAYSTTNFVIQKIILMAMMLTIIFISYVMIFRILVAPALIKDATHLNVFQSALYPLLYSVDYFFDKNFLLWLL